MGVEGLTTVGKELLMLAIMNARGRFTYSNDDQPYCVIGYLASYVGVDIAVLNRWKLESVANVVAGGATSGRRLRWFDAQATIDGEQRDLLPGLQEINDNMNWATDETVFRAKREMIDLVLATPTVKIAGLLPTGKTY